MTVDIDELTKAVGELDDEKKAEFLKALGIEQPEKETPEEFKARVLKAFAESEEDELLKGADDKTVEVVKVLRDEIQKAREDAEQAKKEVEEQKEELKKAREADKERTFIAQAKGYDKLPADPEEFGLILKKVHGTLNDEERKEFDRVLNAYDEAVVNDALLKELGRDVEEGSAEAEVAGKAEELMKADANLTRAQALAKVAKQFPELYERATQEELDRKKKKE